MKIKKRATILKIMNNKEENNELNNLISNIVKFEKEINVNSTHKNYFFKQIKKIKDMDFQSQNSDEQGVSLQKIDEEMDFKKENEKLKKDINFNELFLCPKCLKKIPLFISFQIQNEQKHNILVNYLYSCNNKFQTIALDDLLNKWKDKKNISSKCNFHSSEGKYYLKYDKGLCPDCTIVHEDIKSSHKDLCQKRN